MGNDISLIANSGIQLHTIPLHIDLDDCDKTLLFHEWFDDELSQFNLELACFLKQNKVTIKRSQLESANFIDSVNGNFIVAENEVLSVPNLTILHTGEVKDSDELFYMSGSSKHSKLSSFMNQWVIVPYFELDSMGETKLGPYNWCRCKIIPSDITGSTIDGTLLLAFDTHAIYGMAETYSECPVFESDSEMDKSFSFCNHPSMILDFCSGENTWVRDALMEMVHHVGDMEDIRTDISRGEHKYDFLATYIWLMDYLSKHVSVPEVRLIRDRGVSNIPVEMVIDIGNSRTAAILYEGDFSKVVPLALQNFDNPVGTDGKLNKADESFDMRIAFRKVDFGYNMIGSQQFVWPSMVRLGTEAHKLTYRTADLKEGDEMFSTYSSPKRYLWDNKRRKEEWRCVNNDEDERNERPEIPGISNFFADNGQLDPDELGYGFHYSRKTLMTLAFMEILAQTNAQINSYEYRSNKGKLSTGRFLDKVILTCPTGMSKKEQQSLHDCMRDALHVLGKFYHNYDETYEPNEVTIEPNLSANDENAHWIYDEATCSQFVYLYGLLTETYQNCSLELFKIYGQRRNDNNSLIVGSLDIGAGTSDIMVCRYDYNPVNPARMKPVPLFWDSFDIAGDDMLQVLIANVLLQGKDGLLEKELVNRGEEETSARAKLFDFFGKDQITHSFIDKNLRRDFNLQVLVPIMYEFLKLHTDHEGVRDITYTELFTASEPSKAVQTKFQDVFGFDLKDMVWHYDREILSHHISASMDEKLLQKVAAIMAGYGCDIVLLSGRPTSLDPIREAFLSHAPVRTPDRLICLNKYDIGDWYPFIDKAHRCINNSKSVVPIGAMIGYLSSTAGGLNGFSLDLTELSRLLKPTTNYFLKNDAKVQVNPSFMVPGKRTGEFETNSFPVYIGSRQFDFGIYPVRPFYVFDVDRDGIALKIKSNDPTLNEHQVQRLSEQKVANLLNGIPLTITLSRDEKDDCEALELESIRNTMKDELPTDNFVLSIQSLNDPDCYWLDSGVFDINRAK